MREAAELLTVAEFMRKDATEAILVAKRACFKLDSIMRHEETGDEIVNARKNLDYLLFTLMMIAELADDLEKTIDDLIYKPLVTIP